METSQTWPGSAPGSSSSARSPPAAAPRRRSAQAQPGQGRETVPRKATKTARFLDLVTERHGPLAAIPLSRVAAISAALAPVADLNTGAARIALHRAVLVTSERTPR